MQRSFDEATAPIRARLKELGRTTYKVNQQLLIPKQGKRPGLRGHIPRQ
jgi:hypothetical protein